MKRITTVILLFVAVISYSQSELTKSDIQTTDEEYDFLMDSYKRGGNNKILAGYELKPLMDIESQGFKYNYQLFIEAKSNKVKAIYISLTKEKENDDKVRYLCIPINNDELFKKFTKQLEGLGLSMSYSFNFTGSILVSNLVDYMFNMDIHKIQTTYEEYRFLTEKYSLNPGIELLDGYEFKQLKTETLEKKYNSDYKLFIHSKSQKIKAILIKIEKIKKGGNETEYLCIPINNDTLFQKLEAMDSDLKYGFNYNFILSNFSLVSKLADNQFNTK